MNQMCCAESLLLLVVFNSGLQLVFYVSFYQYYRMEKGKDEFVHCHFFLCVSVFLKIFWCLIHTQNSIFLEMYFLIAVMLNYFHSMLYVFLCLV